ncbi:host-nuclease inhibitor Gam family protein [Clostridium haemolyticum]|uniref:Phage protein n=1 Tax=Clostridium haemolyticum NCTC 9693 TaxID=1443114 RepID=A0ABR4TE16_CLOHA|nr:host-nuclease inhibitor Gam family protein [Clostridium haemolyticum]KEI15787.1 hypothetical protein Z960_11655 [Clostridium haemolyticum NCTC 9693]
MMNALLKNEIKEMNEVIQEQVTTFKVDSLESANWCFRKIRALKEQIETNKALADAERFRIDSWEKKENEGALSTIEYFENLLKTYFSQEREKNQKFKLSTPYGKVSTRKSKKWIYEDEEKIKNWIKDNGYDELIRIKEELDKTALKKAFKEGIDKSTGEIVPGIEIRTEETVSIKVE